MSYTFLAYVCVCISYIVGSLMAVYHPDTHNWINILGNLIISASIIVFALFKREDARQKGLPPKTTTPMSKIKTIGIEISLIIGTAFDLFFIFLAIDVPWLWSLWVGIIVLTIYGINIAVNTARHILGHFFPN
jgi:hypothetical protein